MSRSGSSRLSVSTGNNNDDLQTVKVQLNGAGDEEKPPGVLDLDVNEVIYEAGDEQEDSPDIDI